MGLRPGRAPTLRSRKSESAEAEVAASLLLLRATEGSGTQLGIKLGTKPGTTPGTKPGRRTQILGGGKAARKGGAAGVLRRGRREGERRERRGTGEEAVAAIAEEVAAELAHIAVR